MGDPEELRLAVRALYEVLDDPTARPWGVGGTTRSKVLHRKPSQSVVLHDRWVRACYVGDDAPVPRATSRTWADYMVLITIAIREDMASQPEVFGVLKAAAGEPGRLSDARLLDILAWNSKLRSYDPASMAYEALLRNLAVIGEAVGRCKRDSSCHGPRSVGCRSQVCGTLSCTSTSECIPN